MCPPKPRMHVGLVVERGYPMEDVSTAESDAEAQRPTYKLFSPTHVGVATFLGSPLAGAIIMAVNYARLGRAQAARTAVVLGAIGTGLLVAVGFALPDEVPSSGLGIAGLAVMSLVARKMQSAAFEEHIRRGGKKASGWNAAGVGALCVVAMLAVIFGYIYLAIPGLPREKVVFGPNQEVYYSDGATEDGARKLGSALQEIGFFGGGRGGTVWLKGGERHVVLLVLKPEAFDDLLVMAAFVQVKRELSRSAFDGAPVDLILCDPDLETRMELGWSEEDDGSP